MRVAEAKRLRALQDENRGLKRVVADQALNIQVLRTVLGNDPCGAATASRSVKSRSNARWHFEASRL
jgi:hypothetical protein